MARGSIRRYQGKRGVSYHARIDVGRDPLTGRRRVVRARFDTQQAALDWITEQRRALRTNTYVEASDEPFAATLDHWLATSRAGAASQRRYRSVIDNHLAPALGAVPLSRLTGRQIQQCYTAAAARLARPEIVHIIVHGALEQAVAEGRLARNPATGLRRPAGRARGEEGRRARVWTAEQLSVFLAATRDEADGPLWWLLAYSGLRGAEAVALRWPALDLSAGRLRVESNQTFDADGRRVIGRTKTAAGRRTIGLDAETVALLRAHRARQHELRLALGAAWTDAGLVFPRLSGQPGTMQFASTLSTRFARHAARLGLPPIGLHGLRHTHASILLAAGRPVHYVSRRLGHASIGITIDLYGHLLPGTELADAEAFAAVLANARDKTGTTTGD